MDTQSYKTVSANPQTVTKEWVVIDATDQVVGRLASMVAYMLRGKNKANFTPNTDCGDNVIVVNAEKVRFTGKKFTDKVYIRHSGYPGGQSFETPKEFMAKKPTEVLRKAIKNMLPKSRLGSVMFRNLYLYEGPEHPHEAQSPKEIKINYKKVN